MLIIHRSKHNGFEYIAIQSDGKEYLFSFNLRINQISLFSGNALTRKFLELIKSKFDYCIECNLTLSITEAISKESGKITEIGITKEEANKIINKINQELNVNLPIF